jgi:rod shape-determining protein MreD
MLEDVLFPLIVVLVDDYVFNTCVYIFSFMLKNRLEYGSYFVKIILPEMLATALLTIIVYKLYVYINRRLKT